MNTDQNTLPHHSRDAERALLGSMLRDEKIIPDVVMIVRAGDFYIHAHALIYDVMISLADIGKEANIVTIAERLTAAGQMADAGGEIYLADLWDASPSAGAFRQYAETIRAAWTRRQIIHASAENAADANDLVMTPAEIIEQAERRILAIADVNTTSNNCTLEEALRESYDRLDTRTGRHASGERHGVPTGLVDLDDLLCGFQRGELIILAARPSVGKAQPLDSQVLTPTGYVDFGSLKVGEMVVGSTGLPTRVTHIYPQGEIPVFRVTMSDGRSTECCEDHLWFTQTRNERRRGCDGSIKSLREIRESLGRPDHLSTPNHAMPIVAPVSFEIEHAPPTLHPYALGLLLGDGGFSKMISFTNPEKDIQAKLQSLLPNADTLSLGNDGLNHRIKRKVKDETRDRLGRLAYDGSETKKLIASLGLDGKDSYTKFIPREYLFGTVAERVALLQGLMDSDGYVEPSGKCFELSTSSRDLAQGVLFLVRSLGGIIASAVKKPTYSYLGEKKTGADSYRMTIQFNNGIVPVTSQKHRAKVTTDGRQHHLCIASIEPTGAKPCQCIRVEASDHLYVTDDFILTHNTSLGLQFAAYASVDTKIPTLFVSLEQGRTELADRLLCAYGRVDSYKMRRGHLNTEDQTRLLDAGDLLAKSKLFFDDCPQQNMMRIAANARRMKARHGVEIVFVDYLQLIDADNHRANRQEQVSAISRRLKGLARELQIPVVAMAQVNRASEDRANSRPKLSDLRESGAIEQDADTVIMLHRNGSENVIEAIVAKQRNGPTGDCKLVLEKQYMRFCNAPQDWRGSE